MWKIVQTKMKVIDEVGKTAGVLVSKNIETKIKSA
jgi:hypothetical protein